MTKNALITLWEQITTRLSNKANIDEVVYVDTYNSTTGEATPVNADTLGGIAASQYVLKTNMADEFVTREEADNYLTSSDISNLASASDVTTSSALTVSIDTSAWNDTSATVTANGVTASNTIITTYHPDSYTAAFNAGIYCSAQATNSLTFSCVTVPTTTIKINVLILEGVK